MLNAVDYQDDGRSSISAAEVLTVAIVAARYFRNHWERALCILIQRGEIRPISVSRLIGACTACTTGCMAWW